MSFQTPASFAERATFRDDSAEHQIRIEREGSDITVSCTCQSTAYRNAWGSSYKPIASIVDADEAWIHWHAYHDRLDIDV